MLTEADLARLYAHASIGPLQSEVKRWKILELIEMVRTLQREKEEYEARLGTWFGPKPEPSDSGV